MSFHSGQFATIAGVLAIIVAVMVYNGTAAKRSIVAERARREGGRAALVPPPVGFVGKYAHFDGQVVGRIVEEVGSDLVLEQAGIRKRVPKVAAKDMGDDVRLSQAPEA